MKKIIFTIAAFATLLRVYAQNIDAGFSSRKLTLEEVNFISSYYVQDGSNSAVTGGIGSEKLTDISNVLDVKLIKYGKKECKHTLLAEVGVDHYSSASSDMIDLRANSSASHADTRVYPSLVWSVDNTAKRSIISGGVSYSHEFDYQSLGANMSFSRKTKSKMGEFTAKALVYLDQVRLITPVELRTISGGRRRDEYATTSRNTYVGSLSYSQIVNERLQLILLGDVIYQKGVLSLPFHRVYYDDATVHEENLPGTRMKIPVGIRANYFIGDRLIVRTYYRYYVDSWGIQSHTINIELPVKITPFISVSPFYRYYTQTAANYFAPYMKHIATDQYYTSSYDLSGFTSNFIGLGLRFAPNKGVLGVKQLVMLELRYGHYARSTSFHSNIISMNLKFK